MIQSTSNESNSTKIDSSLFPVLMDFEQSRILGRTVFSLIQPFEDMQCEKIEEKQGGNNLVKVIFGNLKVMFRWKMTSLF